MTFAHLERQIKKNIYGKAQVAEIVAPPGFSSVTAEEVKFILSSLHQKSRHEAQVVVRNGVVVVESVGFSALEEVLLRSLCATDVRLRIHRGRAQGYDGVAREFAQIPWELFFPPGSALCFRVQVTGSLASHEGKVLELANSFVRSRGFEATKTASDAGFRLFLTLKSNVLELSVSLAGENLAHRGYRSAQGAKAPLREDLAACAVRASLDWTNTHHGAMPCPDCLLLPFAGSGTLMFESLLASRRLSAVPFGRTFALDKMVCARPAALAWLRKILAQEFQHDFEKNGALPVLAVERNPQAAEEMLANVSTFFAGTRSYCAHEILSFHLKTEDFLRTNTESFLSGDCRHVFMPMNPPYGVRLGGEAFDARRFYGSVGKKAREISLLCTQKNKCFSGFVLAPDAATSKAFLDNLSSSLQTKTVHFTQGGMDIRLVLFAAPFSET